MNEQEIVWTGVAAAQLRRAVSTTSWTEVSGAAMWLPLHVRSGVFRIRFRLRPQNPELCQLRILLRPNGCLPRELVVGKHGEQTLYTTATLGVGDAVVGEWRSISGNLITTEGYHLRVERGLLDAIAEAAND